MSNMSFLLPGQAPNVSYTSAHLRTARGQSAMAAMQMPEQQPPSSTSSLTGINTTKSSVPAPIRCWTGNCKGQEFSSKGNYQRHSREQHRGAKRFECSRCGRVFSRSTARNMHYENRKCQIVTVDENGVLVSLPFPDLDETETFPPTEVLKTPPYNVTGEFTGIGLSYLTPQSSETIVDQSNVVSQSGYCDAEKGFNGSAYDGYQWDICGDSTQITHECMEMPWDTVPEQATTAAAPALTGLVFPRTMTNTWCPH